MSSDESDDEPLSVLAANKKKSLPVVRKNVYKIKKTRKSIFKRFPVTIELSKPRAYVPEIPPTDVWLYLKDLNPTGPYSCLLCADWFINRSRLVLHYVLNHKKDFCGICRYFVPDRESYITHMKMHSPWQCSQCTDVFIGENELRDHLSTAHKLVHCRICHFLLPDDNTYDCHLQQKHSVNNVSSKNDNVLWEVNGDTVKFLCILCSKSNVMCNNFFNHYMCYHRFTLKCMTSIVSGNDPPFTISGANIRAQFVESQLTQEKNLENDSYNNDNEIKHDMNDLLLNALIPEVKQEILSDSEDIPVKSNYRKPKVSNSTIDYEGVEDFDVTLTEIIIFNKCYNDYLKEIQALTKSGRVPELSEITYDVNPEQRPFNCSMCTDIYNERSDFEIHATKMHSLKVEPEFNCRICLLSFDTLNDLSTHRGEELGEFTNLWLCQFCDEEFENRGACRQHLTSHWDLVDTDNCYSPHIGFKCRYCAKLFWFENDREWHQCEEHFDENIKDFYTCGECNNVFSDKVWFISHYYQNHIENGKELSYLHKCCVCSLVTGNIEDTRNHFQMKHPILKRMFCSLDPCKNKPFAQKKSFKYHVMTVHAPSRSRPDISFCDACHREFKTYRAYTTHMTTAHGTGRFKCKLCSETMLTGDERKLHYLLKHPGQHPYKCPRCGRQFTHKSSMYGHMATVHNHKDQTFKCQHCGKEFTKKESFKEHVLIHEGPRHSCSYCPMTFAQRSNMLRHERRHTGERPYTCPHCARTFADKGACSSHVRTHLKTSFPCMYCGQAFAQKSKLTYHIRKHTGQNLEECSVCSKIFTSGCSLREHMKTHRNKDEPQVECPICNRKYVDERHMHRHIKNCHSNAEFTCPVCGKQLGSSISLRQHVVIHATKNMFRCTCCRKSFHQIKGAYRHVRRKHNYKDVKYNVQKYVRTLNVKDIGLNLDEDTLIQIFGEKRVKGTKCNSNLPPTTTKENYTNKVKGKSNVTKSNVTKKLAKTQNENSNTTNDGTTTIKIEPLSESEQISENEQMSENERLSENGEIEPIDFVTVKIEPMDE